MYCTAIKHNCYIVCEKNECFIEKLPLKRQQVRNNNWIRPIELCTWLRDTHFNDALEIRIGNTLEPVGIQSQRTEGYFVPSSFLFFYACTLSRRFAFTNPLAWHLLVDCLTNALWKKISLFSLFFSQPFFFLSVPYISLWILNGRL